MAPPTVTQTEGSASRGEVRHEHPRARSSKHKNLNLSVICLQSNRVAREVTLPWLSHHRTYGSVSRRFLS
jgi:hypothetical protein